MRRPTLQSGALLLITCLLLTCVPSLAEKGVPLPPHKVVSNTSLAPKAGRRIEIHVKDTRITKAQVKAIIAAYRMKAAPRGQVSVYKPTKDGEMLPWGVENMDGGGVFFNDYFFE